MRPVIFSSIAILFTLASAGPGLAAADPADVHPDLHVIPWPKALERGSGRMALTTESRIVVGDDSLRPLATILADEIATLTGLKLVVAAGPGRAGDIILKINPALKAGDPILMMRNRELVRTTDGAHAIDIGEQAVVAGFDYRAAAEGTATLLQLLRKNGEAYSLPHVRIKDWPHADYCGVMLDVARQDHPIEAIKKIVEICRFYKARYLQLHLTDDQGWTFPSTKYPKLGTRNYGAHGGIAPRLYKLDELKELVAFADARGVTIVPELEMPGHSGAALRTVPEIFDAINPQSKQPVGMGCMNISNEAIYPALDTIIGEMCDVFRSSPYFHFGSDEVTYGRLSLHPGYKAFMAKHNLKNDEALARYFVATACALVKKHGKKAIKWEGLANTASKDVIIMAWDANSTVASDVQRLGYTTITCPWNLGVPWEQWNMYVCNGSRLKKGDSVLGATLVAWEQPPATHIANLRNLASRQERTWGPDNAVTVEGFASRFQPLDAKLGRLIDLPPKPRLDATFNSTAGVEGYLDPVFAVDGRDDTFFRSATPPKKGDSFTISLPRMTAVYSLEVLTGINRGGLIDGGEVQVSADGEQFTTVATLKQGTAQVVLKENRVRALRIRAAEDQKAPMVVRAVNLRLMVELAGKISNPSAKIGEGNVGVIAKDVEFTYPIGTLAAPVVNRGFTLKINNGGNPCNISGPIAGTGKLEMVAGKTASLTLDGKTANSLDGKWLLRSGPIVLAKMAGVEALGGTIELSDSASLVWNASDQVRKSSVVRLRAGMLNMNGHEDTLARLEIAKGSRILTGSGGVLAVKELSFDGKEVPRGVYASSEWVQGGGYVIVGDVRQVEISGSVKGPARTIGTGNIAKLTADASLELPEVPVSYALALNGHRLTLSCGGSSSFEGFITGSGSLNVESSVNQPLGLGGSASNTFKGATTLTRGKLKLNKPADAIAIPGDLIVSGSTTGNGVLLAADGQIAPSATVNLTGIQPSFLDLNGHKAAFSKLLLARAAQVRTGDAGTLHVKQLHVDGTRLKDGVYRSPLPWLTGTGTVTVDCRVDVKGVIGAPEMAIGVGNIGNLTGPTKIGYPSSGGDFNIITNGQTLTLDSGDGNAFAFSGAISGTGDVEFFMGPSYTGYRDAPMILGGPKANTATGQFRVKKGRVQLEKPVGVVAISGDVIVGGQGFNDCLYWKNSHQLKETVNITLRDAGNSGAAYLHLNGCKDSAASLTMTANNKVLTDSAKGEAGELVVKALTIAGKARPAGTYTAATEKWIEGHGRVVVAP